MEVKMNPYNNIQFTGDEPTMAAICDSENIVFAWLKVAQNNGCAGVDSITIEQFAQNVEGNLIRLQEDVITGAYQPSPLLRFYVAKGEDDSRAISVPTVRDRVAVQAATAVLTPILDATFEECSYGYRKGKGRRQALMEIIRLRDMGYIYVLDADIEKFFDNIDHFLLIQRLADLVPEESVARLVASWLTVDIHDGNNVYQLTKGVPQGSSLSPLLSNLYLDLFDKVMMERGYKLIRYCDDFVVLAQHHAVALEAHQLSEHLLGQLKLRLKAEKTQIVTFEQGFRYLGVTFKGQAVFTEGLDNLRLTETPKLIESSQNRENTPDLLQKFDLMDDSIPLIGETRERILPHRVGFNLSGIYPPGKGNEMGGIDTLDVTGGFVTADNHQPKTRRGAPVHAPSFSAAEILNALSNVQQNEMPNNNVRESLNSTVPADRPALGGNEWREVETSPASEQTSVSNEPPACAGTADRSHESWIAQQLREMHSTIQKLRQEIGAVQGNEADEPIAKDNNQSFSTSRLLSTLYLSEQGSYLSYSQKRLMVKKGEEVIMELPAIKIQQVIVFGQCGITTPALDFCLKASIPISFLSVHGAYYGRLTPPAAKQVTLHQQQFQKIQDTSFALNIAKSFVDGKIHNQRVLLQRRHWRQNDTELESAINFLAEMQKKAQNATTLDELRGYEGTSSAEYFRVFGLLLDDSFSFEKRIKHPPTDPVNALLSFGYTLLFQNIYSLVEAHGLHPYCGHLHALRDGHPALISDLIEEFRAPVVDSLVVYLINSHIIKPEHFEKNQEAQKPCLLTSEGRKTFVAQFETKMLSTWTHPHTNYTVDYRRLIALQITELAQCIRGEREYYRPMKVR
jgi:CRISPR-associated endonuclease Cas1/group II intron reverse transcriptase/maturase